MKQCQISQKIMERLCQIHANFVAICIAPTHSKTVNLIKVLFSSDICLHNKFIISSSSDVTDQFSNFSLLQLHTNVS